MIPHFSISDASFFLFPKSHSLASFFDTTRSKNPATEEDRQNPIFSFIYPASQHILVIKITGTISILHQKILLDIFYWKG